MAFINNFDITNPPKGAWIRQQGKAVTFGANLASPAPIFNALSSCIILTTIMVFVYSKNTFNLEISQLLDLTFIILPLTLLFNIKGLITVLFGKVEIVVDPIEVSIQSGLGLTKKKKINLEQLQEVKMHQKKQRKGSYEVILITQQGKKDITIARYLVPERRQYLLQTFLRVLEDKKQGLNSVRPDAVDLTDHLIG